MSDLTAREIDQFRELLEDARSVTVALLKQTAEDTKAPAVSGGAIGRLTRMDAMQMQAMAQMNRRQLQVRLQQIDAALMAIVRGTYGICRHCKEPIGRHRLEALPEAPFCVYCQEDFE